MNDKANKERALELCCEYIEKSAKMMNDAILCISALENDDDIQECIAKVVSCFNVSIEFVVAAVNSHRNGGHACGECKNYGNKLPLKCAYRGVNHPACDEFEPKVMFIPDTPETREQSSKVAEILHEAETVPVVTEQVEPKKCENCFWYCRTCHNKESAFYGDVMGKLGYCVHHDYKSVETNMKIEQDEQKQDEEKSCSVCEYFKKYDIVTDSGIAGRCIESDTNIYEEEMNVCFCKEFKPAHDAVNHPSHYTAGGIECIEALKAATTGLNGIKAVCVANAIKYLWRHAHKNGIEDLKKSIWYTQRLIEEYENEKSDT